MGKSKSWFDLNHDWITHNDLIWRIMIWFGKRVSWFGFDLFVIWFLIWGFDLNHFFANDLWFVLVIWFVICPSLTDGAVTFPRVNIWEYVVHLIIVYLVECLTVACCWVVWFKLGLSCSVLTLWLGFVACKIVLEMTYYVSGLGGGREVVKPYSLHFKVTFRVMIRFRVRLVSGYAPFLQQYRGLWTDAEQKREN